ISIQLVNISQQLADIHNQLGFTLTRVNTIETVLNITSISPEQADIINNNKYKNSLDDMKEEDNEVITAGIDISKSIVRQQEFQIIELQLENSILKSNLTIVINVDEDFTDHNIATTSFYISELVPQSNKASVKKISFHYDKMSHED
ncbi:2743_t:CDS:2, partial [Funneliformis geosporum]